MPRSPQTRKWTQCLAAITLSATSTACGGSAVAAVLVGVTALAAVPLGIASGISGIAGMITSQVQHNYANKRCMAAEQRTLAHNALAEVNRIVSLAIQDKEISHDEYTQVLSARQMYYTHVNTLEQKKGKRKEKN